MVILRVNWNGSTTTSDYWLDSGEHFLSFFSTIWYRLENRKWGSRFPVTMNKLYQGYAAASDMDAFAAELKVIQEEFRQLPVYKLTWNYEKPEACPPDGLQFDAPVHTCEDFFCHCNGIDLFSKLWRCMDDVKYRGTAVHVISSFDEQIPQMVYDEVQKRAKRREEYLKRKER